MDHGSRAALLRLISLRLCGLQVGLTGRRFTQCGPLYLADFVNLEGITGVDRHLFESAVSEIDLGRVYVGEGQRFARLAVI